MRVRVVLLSDNEVRLHTIRAMRWCQLFSHIDQQYSFWRSTDIELWFELGSELKA